jgi:hypothetical protein
MGPIVAKRAHRNAVRMTDKKISQGKMKDNGIAVKTLLCEAIVQPIATPINV